MPQSPTPNMGLVLPDDHGSADIWDTIFDASYQLIDSHNHTAGRGVAIPVAALNINADVSWSFGGTSHSITDLVAIDFAPTTTSTVAGLAGALFINSADSNLYFRTLGGSNVQVTAGAALNVSAFTGGIGGDYASVGALELFDDATDSFWFQQQIGSGVRQYARMRSADLDLYEYKAQPAAGVPTNRVRLASPTSLAASYALTLPSALPTSTLSGFFRVDATGVISLSSPKFYHCANSYTSVGTSQISATFVQFTSAGTILCPLIVNPGDSLDSFTVFITKLTSSAVTVTARLVDVNMTTGSSGFIGGTASNSGNITGPGTLTLSSLGAIAQANHSYTIVVTSTASNDEIHGWTTP